MCVASITEDLNPSLFNMITGINELKTLTKHISCKYKFTFDGGKCNSDEWWNNDKLWCEGKKHHVFKINHAWIPATCVCENGKYLASNMDDSAIICNEVIESSDEKIKTIPTNFNKKKAISKTQSFYILFAFLLITTALLIAVSVYCYLIKYWARQLLPFHYTNKELREVYY